MYPLFPLHSPPIAPRSDLPCSGHQQTRPHWITDHQPPLTLGRLPLAVPKQTEKPPSRAVTCTLLHVMTCHAGPPANPAPPTRLLWITEPPPPTLERLPLAVLKGAEKPLKGTHLFLIARNGLPSRATSKHDPPSRFWWVTASHPASSWGVWEAQKLPSKGTYLFLIALIPHLQKPTLTSSTAGVTI